MLQKWKENCEAIKSWSIKHICVSHSLINPLTPSGFSYNDFQTHLPLLGLPLHSCYKSDKLLRLADCYCKAKQTDTKKGAFQDLEQDPGHFCLIYKALICANKCVQAYAGRDRACRSLQPNTRSSRLKTTHASKISTAKFQMLCFPLFQLSLSSFPYMPIRKKQ